MTNIIGIATAAMSAVSTIPIPIQAPPSINWTVVIAVASLSIAAMVAFINIYKSKRAINDEDLRESGLIQDIRKDTQKTKDAQDSLKEIAQKLQLEITEIKLEIKNNNSSFDEMKKYNTELLLKLDELLQQVMALVDN